MVWQKKCWGSKQEYAQFQIIVFTSFVTITTAKTFLLHCCVLRATGHMNCYWPTTITISTQRKNKPLAFEINTFLKPQSDLYVAIRPDKFTRLLFCRSFGYIVFVIHLKFKTLKYIFYTLVIVYIPSLIRHFTKQVKFKASNLKVENIQGTRRWSISFQYCIILYNLNFRQFHKRVIFVSINA